MKRFFAFIAMAAMALGCSQPEASNTEEPTPEPNPGLIVFKASLTTQAATDITKSSAVLHASYDGVDEEFDPQEVVFRYGTDASSLTNVVAAEQQVSGPSGTFSAAIKELTNGQTYYFQATMDAWNPVRKKYVTVSGKVLSFTTEKLIEFKASLTTQAATDITKSSAVLHASYDGVDEEFDPQEVVFRYGTDASSLTNVVAAEQQVSGPSGTFSASVKELTNGQTYYFQATMDAWNPVRKKYVTVSGKVLSFTTEKQQETISGSMPGWAELPAMDIKQNGSYKISASDDNLYYAWHFSPDVYGPGNKPARNYTVCFSASDHCPLWVAAPRHSMYVGGSGRNDSYRADPDIPSNIQYNSTKTGGGCNKGHMLGSAERTCSVGTNRQVFYYSNIAPQLSSGFNTGGGGWNLLEDYMDSQVCRDTLYEVVGCYFDKYTDGYGETATPDKISFGGRNDVSIPTMFYYAVLRTKKGNTGKSVKDCSANELQCVAFVRTHTNDLKGQKPSSKELMSISDLEKITGFTYFTNVPNAPKSTYSASDWGL